MNKYRIIIEVDATNLQLVQVIAASLRELTQQIVASDSMAELLGDYEDEDLHYRANVAIEEQPPADWQPREFRTLRSLLKEDDYEAWTAMLELADGPRPS